MFCTRTRKELVNDCKKQLAKIEKLYKQAQLDFASHCCSERCIDENIPNPNPKHKAPKFNNCWFYKQTMSYYNMAVEMITLIERNEHLPD